MLDFDTAADPVSVAEPPAVASADAPPVRELPIHFSGSGVEYLRIWLLHLLLIVLTLGLYLPFAKARRIRYLYANSWIDGDALAFHGDPKTMFRGFMVLVALFGIYAIGGRFAPLAGYVAFLGLCVLWPALWRAGQQFRLANTSWRGLRFAFRGDLGDAYSAFGVVIWPLVLVVGVQRVAEDLVTGRVAFSPQGTTWVVGATAVVGGIGTLLYVCLLPLALAKVKRYQHNHYQLADQRAQLQVKTRRFYALAAKTACWVVVPLLALVGLLMIPAVRGWFDSNKTVGLAAMTGIVGASAVLRAGCSLLQRQAAEPGLGPHVVGAGALFQPPEVSQPGLADGPELDLDPADAGPVPPLRRHQYVEAEAGGGQHPCQWLHGRLGRSRKRQLRRRLRRGRRGLLWHRPRPMNACASPILAVQWFDGLHPVARPATVWFDEQRVCLQAGDDAQPLDYSPAKLRWPEPLRRGQRQVLLPDGGVLVCADAAAYDAWLKLSGRRHGRIARWQQHGWLALLTFAL
ncbi:MAG: DUF898 family protein, partial [Rubrivivax sp.]